MSMPSLPVTVVAPVFSREKVATTQQSEPVPSLPVHARDPWTINLLVRVDRQPANRTLIVGFGSLSADSPGRGRYLAKFANGIHFWSHNRDVESTTPLELGRWQMVSATYDGRVLSLYQNGRSIGRQELELSDDQAVMHVAPLDPWDKKRSFEGQIKDLTFWDTALTPEALTMLWQATAGDAK